MNWERAQSEIGWFKWVALFFWLLLGMGGRPAEAQLATTFSNITGIKVTRLPNAVVVRIQTDGTVRFGGDYSDWTNNGNFYDLRETQSVRLRIVQARSKLPAYVPIDAYPLDGAAITLGRTPFTNPIFSNGASSDLQPLIDVELRFAVPVTISKFSVQPGRDYGEYLGPREASIEMSNDRRAIVITVIPDRADLTAPQRLDRSPLSLRKHKLSVTPLENGSFRLEALHSPLREVLAQVTEATGTRFIARDEVADVPLSLLLPRTNMQEFLQVLQRTVNLGVREENGALLLGRGDDFFAAKSLPLFNLSPDSARLLFPDFLLPYLRPDRQNNSLLAVQTPLILNKIEAQLRRIDTPRAQFEISAQFWEIAKTKDTDTGIQLLRSIGGDQESANFETGEAFVRVQSGQKAQLNASLRLLSTQGRARLAGNPRISVLSGAPGSLFLGQTRYVQVVQNSGRGQYAIALPLNVGAELFVWARGSNTLHDPVGLYIAPRLSTVDDVEARTGLPTLGIRQLSGSLLIGEGDTVAFAGLESDIDFGAKRKALGFFPSTRSDREVRSLLVLVSVRRITWSEPRTTPDGRIKHRGVAINPLYDVPN